MASNKAKKKNKKFNFKSPVFIVFLLAIVGLGIFIVFSTLASNGQLGASKVLVSKASEHLGYTDGELIAVEPTSPFLLYDNGLAICGDYPEADKKHNLPYYSKTLTPQERDNFVTSIVATGFMDLKQNYPNVVVDYDSISVATANKTNVVNVDHGYSGADAAAYAKSDDIITGFCNSLNIPYEPEEVEVKTKVVSPSIGKKGESALDPELSIPTDNAIKNQSIKGATAKKLYKTHGKKGEKFSNTPKGVVQSVVKPILPPGILISPTIDLPPQSSNGGNMVVPAANAAKDPPLPTEFYRFCPKFKSCPDDYPTVNDMITQVNNWYAVWVGAKFDIKNMDLLVGLHDEKWYISYQPVVADYIGKSYTPSSTPDEYVLPNLRYELYVERKWPLNTPRILNYQGTTGNTTSRTWCGYAYQTIIEDLYKGKGEFGITTKEAPDSVHICDGVGMNWFFGTVAHELGHTQSLWHTNGLPGGPWLMSGCKLNNCYLPDTQPNAQRSVVRGYSPFVKLVK